MWVASCESGEKLYDKIFDMAAEKYQAAAIAEKVGNMLCSAPVRGVADWIRDNARDLMGAIAFYHDHKVE